MKKNKYITQIIARLDLKVIQIEPILANSSSSEVYKITLENSRDAILKIPFKKEKLYREASMLKQLYNLPTPRVLDQCDGDKDSPGALLLSYISGDSVDYPDKNLAFQMGQLLGRLHNIVLPEFKSFKELDWLDFIDHKFNRIIHNCTEFIELDLLQRIQKYKFEVFANYPSNNGPCIVHCDYQPRNILVKNNKITGLIDFESARAGSADFDFAKMRSALDETVWESFCSGYQSVRPLPKLDMLLNFNILFHALNGIDFAVQRGIAAHKRFLDESVLIINKVMDEVSI